MQLPHSHNDVSLRAHLLTRDLPRDQALGLRLLALARAAAGLHMAHAALAPAGADSDPVAQDEDAAPQFVRSQAAGLMARLKAHAEDAGS